MTVSDTSGTENGLGGEFSRKHFVGITFEFNCFDVAEHPHRAEDGNDNKSVLRSKSTCSSVHEGAPDLQALSDQTFWCSTTKAVSSYRVNIESTTRK